MAEYVACYNATCQAMILRNLIKGLKIVTSIQRPIRMYCDNSAAVNFSNSYSSSGAGLYLDTKYLFVRERMEDQSVIVEYISTHDMLANPLTKDDNCNVNGSKPAACLYRQAGELTGLRNGDAVDGLDMVGKHLQRKSGKGCRSNGNGNGNGSRRSRLAHMEGSLDVTAGVDGNNVVRYSVVDRTQTGRHKTVVSGKRSEKRSGKISKSKCDSFSVKAGLSNFSSAAGGNNVLGVYGSKHDVREFAKHVKEMSLKELLDGSYKCPDSIKVKEKSTEALNGSILQSVREACSVLHLHKLTQTPKVPAVDASFNYLTNSSTNDDNKGDAVDPSACNKVESCAGAINNRANILQFPLFEPKDILDRLTLPPDKDLDVMLLDSMKPTLSLKVHNGGSLPMFPWSHVSGGHFKANLDVVKSTPSKSACQSRWVKMGKSTASLRDINATTYLQDFQSFTYNQSLVPLQTQQPQSTVKVDQEITPSGTRTTASKGCM
ncbi:uncharacterized protein LOC143581123 [Bidens hawaiensis]|uniref:uncharacterized protein LOC143581123 n=1 Tax=Bidens hawaiensis TaxID=980011 RepID=UPI004049F52A